MNEAMSMPSYLSEVIDEEIYLITLTNSTTHIAM